MEAELIAGKLYSIISTLNMNASNFEEFNNALGEKDKKMTRYIEVNFFDRSELSSMASIEIEIFLARAFIYEWRKPTGSR